MESTFGTATRKITGALRNRWPDHGRFLDASFGGRSEVLMRSTERWAARILRVLEVTGLSLDQVCDDYRFLCGVVIEEEVYFRRHGKYRLDRFEDAVRDVYSNRVFMDRYMNFLLLSHVVWSNHAAAMEHFERAYLATLQPGTRHLEIGPGHGLLLYCAAEYPAVSDVVAWDVSASSIELTRRCLGALGLQRPARLVLQDLFDAPKSGERFDSVVLAEVLEHLEDPVAALRAVQKHMAPGGRMWIHVPINSPAPDHLYLLRTPEESVALVRSAGLEVEEAQFFPMSGATLEKAIAKELTISATLTARRAA